MPWIDTSTLSPDDPLHPAINHQVYNGLDCCITLEVREELERIHGSTSPIYSFERALQGPYLEIMQRGFAIDHFGRMDAARSLRIRMARLEANLNLMADAVWDRGLNSRSPTQLKEFFYNRLRCPEVWLSKKGVKSLSTNREALEKLDGILDARPFVSSILAIRDIGKQLDVFESEVDADGRWRTSYNIAGTETGRPSSSGNSEGSGGNAQNIAPGLRYVFRADPGTKICVIDLEQVEARDVGFIIGCLFGDWKFLDSCESGDLHTNNARLIWRDTLQWTDDPVQNRKVAETQFYREYSHRDMSKRGGHLTNYYGTAYTASRSLKAPLSVMDEFQARYCKGRPEDTKRGLPAIVPAFPGIPQWWAWTATQLQTTQKLRTLFGRERHFFGRPDDDTTLREAIAFLPQGTTADRMNLGLWRTWKREPTAQLLAQTHDSITFQAPDDRKFDDLVGRIIEHLRVDIMSPSGRNYWVPGEAKVGWNWGSRVTQADREKAVASGRKAPTLNEHGLVKWKPGADKRTPPTYAFTSSGK